jgi:hypothetical protein
MDSTAIYVTASSELVAEGDLRWRLAAHERHAFLSDFVPAMMKWKWRDYETGEFIAPAFDEQPELPELSRWMPTDSKKTWDDLPRGEVKTEGLKDVLMSAGEIDCVLVYQYA